MPSYAGFCVHPFNVVPRSPEHKLIPPHLLLLLLHSEIFLHLLPNLFYITTISYLPWFAYQHTCVCITWISLPSVPFITFTAVNNSLHSHYFYLSAVCVSLMLYGILSLVISILWILSATPASQSLLYLPASSPYNCKHVLYALPLPCLMATSSLSIAFLPGLYFFILSTWAERRYWPGLPGARRAAHIRLAYLTEGRHHMPSVNRCLRNSSARTNAVRQARIPVALK